MIATSYSKKYYLKKIFNFLTAILFGNQPETALQSS